MSLRTRRYHHRTEGADESTRDAWQNVRKLVKQLFAQGYSCEYILGVV